MHTQFKRWSLFTALFATLVLALGVGGSPTAQAQDFLAGNPSCPSGLIEYKIEPGPFEGTYSVPGVGTITVDVTGWKDDGEDLVFDWTSSFGIDYVIVKGGPDANGYPYDEATSGTGLTTPGGYAISHISFCYDMPTYQPHSATKTANGTYDRSVSWQLTKSVSPGSFSGTAGQPVGDALWTVTATKSETFTNYMVTGTITITNPNGIDVSVSVSDTLDDGTVATVTCPSNIVPANGSLVCDYVASPSANATKNVAVITSSVPEIGGATAEMGVTYVPSGVVHGDDTVTVNDDRYGGFPQTISASQTFTYTEPFTCSSNQADYTNGSDYDIYPNTATLTGASTNLTASAQVDVACMLPPLVPTKTATGTYDRTITWALDKSVTPDVLNGNAGESAGSVTWTVVATKQETPSNYAVSGTISVYNPASIPQTFSVSDMLDDGTVASNLTCDM